MSDLNQRIESLYQTDKRAALILIALLWIVVLFVVITSWPYIPDGGVRTISLIGAAAVLIFNTAAIMAMISHYAEDKSFIYGMDIKMSDAAKKQSGA